MKAIIIGGGIAGLAAAKALQLLDWKISIYEQAPELKPAGAGIVLSANALKALKAISLYDAVIEKGNILEKFSILDQNGSTLTKTNHLSLSKKFGHLSGISLHRTELQQALLSEIFRLKIRTGKRCKSIVQTGEYVEAEFEDGEKERADLLLGCDGIHSAVRQAIFPATELRYSGYTCWRGVTSHRPAGRETSFASESWGRGKRFGIVPLTNNRVYWFACLNSPNQKDPAMSAMQPQDLQEIYAGFHQPVHEIIKSTPPEALLWNDITDLKPIPSFSSGRVVLLGDAAHATTPNMGQGACQALEDAAVLGSLLQKNDYITAFRKYNQLRLPRTRKIVEQSRLAGKIAQWENPIAVKLRNLLLKSTPASINEKQMTSLFNVEFDKVCNC